MGAHTKETPEDLKITPSARQKALWVGLWVSPGRDLPRGKWQKIKIKRLAGARFPKDLWVK